MKHVVFSICLLIFITFPLTATAQVVTITDPVPPPRSVRDMFELDPFYQQWIDVGGLPVVASEKVNPYALKEAAWQIWQMIGHRPDVLQAFVQKRVRFSIIAHNELISEIPEYSFPFPDFLSFWQRGIGGVGYEVPGHPAVSSAEENILHYLGHRGRGLYNTLIHEFAHAIHLFGLNPIDPTFETRLEAAYDAAIAKGLWQGTYASSDIREYWAEGTHGWFYPKGGGSFTNYGNTRSALKAYDPGLAALLTEIYGDTQWRYTPPADRLSLPHLQGFNPQDSPTYQGFPELEELYYRQFHDPNSDGGDNWVDLRPYDPSLIPILNESRPPGRLTGISFLNVTQADVLLYLVRWDGTERYWTRARPGIARGTPTRTDVLWLIKDPNGKNLAVFQPVEQAGRAIIRTEMGLITPGLSKVSGDNQSGISGAVLSNPFVIEVRDQNFTVLEGISVTFTITAGNGTLSVTYAMTDANGQAETWFTLGASLGTHTVSVSAVGVGQIVVFNATAEAAVNIPDPHLRAVVENTLNKAQGQPITPAEIATLTRLDARNRHIKDLTGLEHGTRFVVLELRENQILNIRPLANLKNLQRLILDENNVRDITPLKNLTQLTWLLIGGNPISDFTPLSNLNQLESLSLYRDQMNDLTPLGSLTKLKFLWLDNNNISNIAPLTELVNLELLYLRDNEIRDMSPLVKLPMLKELRLEGNPLSYQSIHTHIPALQSRGVTVKFTPRTPAPPLVISGDNQQGAPGAALEGPFVVEVRDRIGTPFAGVPVVFTVAEGNGTLSITSSMTDANGSAQSTLTLGSNPGTNTVEVSVEGISETVVFSAEATPPLPTPTALESVSGDHQSGLIGEALMQPFIVEVHDQYDDPMEGVTVTFAVSAGGGSLSDTSGDTDTDGLAETTLTLGSTPGANTVLATVDGIAEPVTFNAVGEVSDLGVDPPSVSKSTVAPGEKFTLSVTVRNQENRRTAGTTLRYYRSTDATISSSDTEVGTASVSGLDANENSDYSISLTAPTAAGVYYYGACVDTVDNETTTANNCAAAVEITVERVPTELVKLSGDNQSGVISQVLSSPFVVEVRDQDQTPLEAVPVMFAVIAGGGMLSATHTNTDASGLAETTLTLGSTPGTNTVLATVDGIAEPVTFNAVGEGIEFDLSMSAGTNLIHVPLKVSAVDGVAKTLTSISDLYDALGGARAVNFLITYDSQTQAWLSYFTTADRDSPANQVLTDDMGIVAGLKTAITIRLRGNPLGTNGTSTITLNQGLNLVGLPLRDSRITRVSDLLSLDGIRGNVPTIILSDAGGFKSVGRAGDLGDVPVTGGQGFILTAQPAATVTISGEGWSNVSAPAAPQILTGLPVSDTTAVLALQGEIVDGVSAVNRVGLRVAVKNLSTGRQVVTTPADAEAGYRLAVVDIETMRAAQVGDTLEITAQSTSPFIGVKPLRYTVTAEDVKQSLIRLPALVAYEIPQETELLANYPNPFNPETWIPYRLAEDDFVTLTIYDGKGHAVRTIDVGHRIAAVYESRSKAIYWDGRNEFGEEVASGVYFYHLSAGDYFATRRMVILK